VTANTNHSGGQEFCPVSLGDWLRAWQARSIPHVPAHLMGMASVDDCMSFDTEGPHINRLSTAFQGAAQARTQGRMIRFDCCSSMELKQRMASGQTDWQPEFAIPVLDDPRLMDILSEFPRPDVPIWSRPWIVAAKVQNYPVEYRAFVRDGLVAGISSYYPQRPLPRFEDQIRTVNHHTEVLADWIQRETAKPLLWPQSPHMLKAQGDGMDPNGVHFTADYLVDEAGGILFLEGGPPHEMGAHPCCFRPGEIKGTALTDRNS